MLTQTLTLILTLIPTLALTQTLTQTDEKHYFGKIATSSLIYSRAPSFFHRRGAKKKFGWRKNLAQLSGTFQPGSAFLNLWMQLLLT